MRSLGIAALLVVTVAAPLAAQNDTLHPAAPSDSAALARPRGIEPKTPPVVSAPADTARARPARGLDAKTPPAAAAESEHGIESTLYLPLDSWATPFVEHLIRAGVLQGLDGLTRPLKRADVARAVARADTAGLPAPVRSQLRLLAGELEERQDTVRWKLDGGLALQGASDASRWTVRPAGDTARVFPAGDLAASLEMPHLGLYVHPYFDNRLKYDPEYIGKKDRFVAGRSDDYLIAAWKYLEVAFGSVSRNWGPPEVEGLLLSTAPYAYDHLFLRLGPARLRLEMVATQLNDLDPWGSTTPAHRFLSVHRLVVVPSDRIAFSLSEAMLYADANGTTRWFEPWYLNPLSFWLLEQYQNKPTGNTLVAADFSWLVRRPSLRLAAQLYADDIQVDRGGSQYNKKPEELGYTFSLTGGALRGLVSWSAFYTRVDALDYRTSSNQEQYSIDSLGLARNHSDYDQLTFRATTAPAPRALLSGELTYIRQGQGDFRLQYPDSTAFADSLVFLTGVVERTLRVAAQASWTPVYGINLSADVGRHFVTNANHVPGARGDRWVWRLKAEIRRRFTGAVRWKD